MYIPKAFENIDREAVVSFMRKYSFGLIITNHEDRNAATHLPFAIEERDGNIVLSSHMAAINHQSVHLLNPQVLVVFSEPHAYISPTNYTREQNVPTWNYASVHIYGKCRLLSAEHDVVKVLEKMIDTYEPAYFEQWKGLSSTYKSALIREITAFEITVDEIQAVNKLSQNKSRTEQQNIIQDLRKHGDGPAQSVAAMMDSNLRRKEES